MPRTYGYARVSSKDQNVARQLDALSRWGIPERDILIDRQSGKDFNRPAYKRLCRLVRPGDAIVITSIDRLGRSYTDVIDQWHYLTHQKGVFLSVLDMPLLDTAPNRDLTQKLISDIVLQLFSYVAEMERNFIRQRQAEGIAAARSRGVKFGAPRKPPPEGFVEMARKWRLGCISERLASSRLGVARSTFRRWVTETEEVVE